MTNRYTTLLQQLSPYGDVVFYYGLSEAEVVSIEAATHARFPAYFRDFLKTFGVRQDLVFGLISKESDFEELSAFLPEEVKRSYVLIGDGGGEDYWLLNAQDESDDSIYDWQH